MTQASAFAGTFRELGIKSGLLTSVERHFTQTTPVQHKVIPIAIENQDVIGIAQTGTGKTLAFGIPLFQKLLLQGGQGLILLPTRELALQVDEMLQKIGRGLGIKIAVLIGGVPMYRQIRMLQNYPDIIVATPGRLFDHLKQRNYSLSKLHTIVLDEADRMLDIGFLPQIRQVLEMAPVNRQTLLFSATMPSDIALIAEKHMKTPHRVELAPAGTPAAHIDQAVCVVARENKPKLLAKILQDQEGSVLVFVRTKHGARKLTRALQGIGHSAAEIHSNCSLSQRKEALAGFKSGKYRILVATDIAARGIHVNDIALVLNFDLPDNTEDYVHRIGRTGRAGKTGKALSFATPDETPAVRAIERLIRTPLEILELPGITGSFVERQRSYAPPSRSRGGFSQRSRSGGQSRFAPRRDRSRAPSRSY